MQAKYSNKRETVYLELDYIARKHNHFHHGLYACSITQYTSYSYDWATKV